ncbi:DUF2945 domain-containing protein [Streptomyces halstedii]|uniref:DUF2945 domain-containing protein n=1 Tax=Streptomyces halstedii TaxID=1944 RepID=A0ABS6TUV7_STRHA|nr:DUF2945 domain-containing protein [Streptomyces halstedii]MBV7672070.1 DUF2945 domain-containing protein [Streptomyces halstedii]
MARKKTGLSKGDQVAWRSHGQKTEGSVTRKVDERTEAAGRTVDASKEKPQYEVKSAKTGRKAVHRRESLHREKGTGEP